MLRLCRGWARRGHTPHRFRRGQVVRMLLGNAARGPIPRTRDTRHSPPASAVQAVVARLTMSRAVSCSPAAVGGTLCRF